MPDPEFVESEPKRRFPPEYKRRILEEADACNNRGELGALLRREGLYSSLLRTWRTQRQKGILEGLRGEKRGPKPHPADYLAQQLSLLEKENQLLRQRLEKAEAIIEIQKKVSHLLGLQLEETPIPSKERTS